MLLWNLFKTSYLGLARTKMCCPPVWPDWAIYCTLGNFSKPLVTINMPKSPTFLGNFVKASIFFLIFLVKSFLGNFYWYLATFYWSHCLLRAISLPFFDLEQLYILSLCHDEGDQMARLFVNFLVIYNIENTQFGKVEYLLNVAKVGKFRHIWSP